DKALAIKDECPKLKWIVWDDPKGMRNYHQDFLISFEKVQDLGRELAEKDPGLFEKRINEGQGDDVCLLFYTSGTTALPKGALLSHWNMLTMGHNLMSVDPCYDTDVFVSYLPFAWIGEQMMSISCGFRWDTPSIFLRSLRRHRKISGRSVLTSCLHRRGSTRE
ncbi:MAG: AMP-binding protein, partial [Desulfobacterales bacterium]